jgi:hypothetical protein
VTASGEKHGLRHARWCVRLADDPCLDGESGVGEQGRHPVGRTEVHVHRHGVAAVAARREAVFVSCAEAVEHAATIAGDRSIPNASTPRSCRYAGT